MHLILTLGQLIINEICRPRRVDVEQVHDCERWIQMESFVQCEFDVTAFVVFDRISLILYIFVMSITDKQGIFPKNRMWGNHLQRTQVRSPQTIQNRGRLCVRSEDVANDQRQDEKEEEEI